ncbi:MAG: FAD-dependent oxidoreductase [Clostridia bacterium]
MRYQSFVEGKQISLEVKPTFSLHLDVLVAGLGTAGAVALCTASALGLHVAGFDRATGMGGMGGMGGVWDYYFGQAGGVTDQINRKCQTLQASGAYVTSQRRALGTRLSYPGVIKSYALEQRAQEKDVSLWYDTVALGAYLEEDRVVGLRLHDGTRRMDIAAEVIIDATGEADIAYLAGCEMLPPREADGTYQYYSKTRSILVQEEGEPPYTVGAWSVCGRMDAANAANTTQAILRAAIHPQEFLHPQAHARTIYESPMLGMREGRRIAPMQALRLREETAGRQWAQPVFYAASHVDSFNRDMALEEEALQDFQSICDLRSVRLTVGVPMGAMIPMRMDGLLVAGRCMGVDHNLAACVRMKYDMEKSGEAAATLAFIACKEKKAPRYVSYEKVAAHLRKTGCLQDTQNQPWKDGARTMECTRFPQCDEEMRIALASDFPGFAMWTAKNAPARWQGMLREALADADDSLRYRAALTLGMMGDEQALPVLRDQMKRSPAPEALYPEACKAICLLGRMGDVQSIPSLMELLKRPLPPRNQRATEAEKRVADHAVYLSLEAVVALVKIMRAHPAHDIRRQMCARLFAPDFILCLGHGDVDLTQSVRRLAIL